MDKKIISIVSGGFDPIHPGHIMMMRDCLEFSNHLIVGVNSNNWLIEKPFSFTISFAPSKCAPTPSSGTKINKKIPTMAPEPHTW